VDEEANVIFGSAVDESLAGRIRVSVVATGIESARSAEQPRPKLVAVGGGAAPAPIPMRTVASPAPAVTPAAAAPPVMLRQVSPHIEDAEPEVATAEPPPAPPVTPVRPLRAQPPAAPAPVRGGLFAQPRQPAPVVAPSYAPPAEPEAPRRSLFGRVTGAFHRPATPTSSYAPPAQSQVDRQDPGLQPAHTEAPRMSVRQASPGDETGFEIPAFLRRQSS
jgi:cell division protein FtsZ